LFKDKTIRSGRCQYLYTFVIISYLVKFCRYSHAIPIDRSVCLQVQTNKYIKNWYSIFKYWRWWTRCYEV